MKTAAEQAIKNNFEKRYVDELPEWIKEIIYANFERGVEWHRNHLLSMGEGKRYVLNLDDFTPPQSMNVAVFSERPNTRFAHEMTEVIELTAYLKKCAEVEEKDKRIAKLISLIRSAAGFVYESDKVGFIKEEIKSVLKEEAELKAAKGEG